MPSMSYSKRAPGNRHGVGNVYGGRPAFTADLGVWPPGQRPRRRAGKGQPSAHRIRSRRSKSRSDCRQNLAQRSSVRECRITGFPRGSSPRAVFNPHRSATVPSGRRRMAADRVASRCEKEPTNIGFRRCLETFAFLDLVYAPSWRWRRRA